MELAEVAAGVLEEVFEGLADDEAGFFDVDSGVAEVTGAAEVVGAGDEAGASAFVEDSLTLVDLGVGEGEGDVETMATCEVAAAT